VGHLLSNLLIGTGIKMATDLAILQRLKTTGHLDFPFGKPRAFTRPLQDCKLTDPDIALSIASYQDFDGVQLDVLAIKHHGRAAMHDGEVGPATMELFDLPRCCVADYGHPVAKALTAEAIGSGPWKGCHAIGNFHSAIVMVDETNLPAWLKPLWVEVLRRVQQAYDEIGLRFVFVTEDRVNYLTGKKFEGSHQTALSFVTSSDGWIGLAIVGGSGMTCSSTPIWLRLLATYTGGSSNEARIQQWTSLVKHELGHNCGLQHSRGGVMNPSIVNGLPVSWSGDPSETLLERLFGGERVPAADPGPTPGPGPAPPSDRLWFKGEVVAMQGETSLGRFILTPASGV
jgi:hypothetical protein